MATSGMDQARLINVCAGITGEAAFTSFTLPPMLRLYTATGSETATGTQLGTAGGYTSGGLTMGSSAFSAPTYSSGAAGNSNNNAVTWTNMPAATLTACEIWDSAGTPLRWVWATLTSSKTTNAGDTLTFAAASVTPSVAG
jgi:hypothetical protein